MRVNTEANSVVIRCPGCYSADVRLGHKRAWDKFLQSLMGLEVFRCRVCRIRFHKPARPLAEVEEPVSEATQTQA